MLKSLFCAVVRDTRWRCSLECVGEDKKVVIARIEDDEHGEITLKRLFTGNVSPLELMLLLDL